MKSQSVIFNRIFQLSRKARRHRHNHRHRLRYLSQRSDPMRMNLSQKKSKTPLSMEKSRTQLPYSSSLRRLLRNLKKMTVSTLH